MFCTASEIMCNSSSESNPSLFITWTYVSDVQCHTETVKTKNILLVTEA